MELSILVMHPERPSLRCLSPRVLDVSVWKASIMPDLAPFLDTTNMYLSAREERRAGKGPGKRQYTTGGDTPYLRMMGSTSQGESRRDPARARHESAVIIDPFVLVGVLYMYVRTMRTRAEGLF
jgi:hypothetical protein